MYTLLIETRSLRCGIVQAAARIVVCRIIRRESNRLQSNMFVSCDVRRAEFVRVDLGSARQREG